jgi:lysophospholipase L1-like esterase
VNNQSGSSFKIYPPFLLVGVVALLCIIVTELPMPSSVFGIELKEVNFFSDFLKSKSKKKIAQKQSVDANLKSAADSLHFKGVAIENFYVSKNDKLISFIDKLKNIKKKKRKVRIAWFGDSMVEGDLFVQDLREALQNQFGGNGVGFVPITSVTGNFRQTIWTENSNNWQTISVLKNAEHKLPLGIGGEAFIPKNGSWVTFAAAKKKNHLDVFHHAELFIYNPDSAASVDIMLDNAAYQHISIPSSAHVQRLELSHQQLFQTIRLTFNAPSTTYVYGVNFDSDNGVFIDNFGVRGASGVAMGAMQPYSLLADWNTEHAYDLMILEYGLNIVSPKTMKYQWFEKSFPKTIQKMEETFPDAATLLLSIGDRAINKNGVYQTMEQVPVFIDIQKNIAKQNNIAFWNMNEAMGGDSSMIKWVNAKPRLANKDYTHINAKGGEVLGKKLFETIWFEVKRRELNL